MQATQQIRIRQTTYSTDEAVIAAVDIKLLAVAALLLIMGLVMVGSASISIADKLLSESTVNTCCLRNCCRLHCVQNSVITLGSIRTMVNYPQHGITGNDIYPWPR